MSEEIIPGDIVAVNLQHHGRREGLVIGSHYDAAGRHIVEIQFEPGDHYHAWYPTVTRVRRTTYYHPEHAHYGHVHRARAIEKHVYW
ncbi:hypothetical protein BOTBODRAFT_31746 [Botryobasidium botryosum FD-172 SS1]|uniref:Hypervirulence associated protein TUDOR domain-containing protein n=1 Tax=Botryobasidium botryosum (strain FD-172 SS1) TaxID=930990 RepID=A0A067MV46_BOTB1|nr:hypothetical protein BOTBODRAFT_31746 [Botryobasidium botryosum FD-172 SS1]